MSRPAGSNSNDKTYRTVLFHQKETGGSHVYGNAVIRALYIPKTVIAELGDPEPEAITIELARKTIQHETQV